MRMRVALAVLLPLTLSLTAPAAAFARVAPAAGSPPSALGLRLNEVDYDQPGIDADEFVEIVNVGSQRSGLRHVALVFVNGATSAEYRRVKLSGRLGPKRRLVVATPMVAAAGGSRVLLLPLTRNNVQNGAPDAVALVDTAGGVLLDSLSYEGPIDQAQIDGFAGPVTLVEGQPVSERDDNETPGSLCRLPDRADTGDDDLDWSSCASTPGAANVELPAPGAHRSRLS